MHAAYAILALATGLPRAASNIAVSTSGFENAEFVPSSDGSAVCIQGNVPVYASTTKNQNITMPVSAITNQTVVTETIVEFLMAGEGLKQKILSGTTTVTGTYNINARLCYPLNTGINAHSVQFLTHGGGFDKAYWDIAPGYSYVDVAAASGYTTFSYDRLCTGLSSHPDAHAVCQGLLQLAIAHSLILMLRNGTFASTPFKHVIGTGHSFGSGITNGLTVEYPADLDAAVLTGFTTNFTGQPTFFASLDLTIANLNNPIRFGGLSNGYFVANNYVGSQFAFLKGGGFPAANLAFAETSKQTLTLGELLTLGPVIGRATNFTGPVAVVDGESDWMLCLGNCTVPTDLAAAVLPNLYPKAPKGSESYLVPLSGHAVNLHYGAQVAFERIMEFVRKSGF